MNCLLIMPNFFNYADIICKELNRLGYKVCFIKEEVRKSVLEKLISKINKNYLKRKFSKNFYKSVYKELEKTDFDLVLVFFGGLFLQKEQVLFLKSKLPHAKFIYYNWDSVINFPSVLNFYKIFDKYYSFDKNDCAKYGFKFLPLFFSEENKRKENVIYDYGVIMTFGWEKAEGYKKIINAIPKNCTSITYLYLSNKLSFFFNKMVHYKYFKGFKMGDFNYKKLSYNETIKFYNSCRAVLDVPLNKQNGLTIRTFEVLGLEKKIITTNLNIKDYEFYTPENIFIVMNDRDKIPSNFFEIPFNKKYGLSDKYSIRSFFFELLS